MKTHAISKALPLGIALALASSLAYANPSFVDESAKPTAADSALKIGLALAILAGEALLLAHMLRIRDRNFLQVTGVLFVMNCCTWGALLASNWWVTVLVYLVDAVPALALFGCVIFVEGLIVVAEMVTVWLLYRGKPSGDRGVRLRLSNVFLKVALANTCSFGAGLIASIWV